MTTQTEERVTAMSGDGAGAFRVVLVASTTLVVAGSVLSLAATGFLVRRFLLAPTATPETMVPFSRGVLQNLLILLPFVALAAIAFRGIRQFPWLGWFLPLYICLLGLGTVVRSLPLGRFMGPDILFGMLLLILALVLLLVRPRPAPSTEPIV